MYLSPPGVHFMFRMTSNILALEKRKLVVGLGNPGRRYERTKHNAGFWVIDELLRREEIGKLKGMCRSLVGTMEWGETGVIFAKPTTYMNSSGEAVAALVNKFDISLPDLCVVYDDLNLELGVLRMRKQGSDGGHNGMKSIIRQLDTEEFPRLRMGIGAPVDSQVDFVLSEFNDADQVTIGEVVQKAADAVETLLQDGLQAAMNGFNGRVE